VAFSTLATDFIPFSGEHTFVAFTVSQAKTRLLACSSSTLTQDERRFLRRIIRNIKRWFRTFWEALVVSARSAEVVIRLSPLAILTSAAVLSSKLSKHDPTYASNVAWWYTLMSVERLGPAFVKLAQWAATRRDIFPPHVCDRFAKLHDKGTSHSWSHSHALLTEAIGDYKSKGLHIDQNHVIGCGSAAQVYSGSLTTNEMTRQVAVKILHPHFQHMVERDLHFFKSVANLLHALPMEKLKMLNLPRVVDNFSIILRRQADLHVEGDNLIQFCSNFNDVDQIGNVFFRVPLMVGWIVTFSWRSW
jgi:aarF domain-containing kinase